MSRPMPTANSTGNNTREDLNLECKQFEFVWLGLVLGTVCLLGYIGNALCLLVLHRAQRHRHSVTFLLLKALAGADLLYLLLYGCIKMWPQLAPGISDYVSPYMYAYVWPFVSMLLSVSTWLMVLLTVHRYIVVCHPLDAQRRSTMRQASVQIAAICAIAVIMDIPRFLEIEVERENSSTLPVMNFTWLYHEYYYHLVYKNGLVLTYRKLLPLAITITLTIRLVSCLYRARHRRRELSHVHHTHQAPPREQRITKALLAVVIVFILCQMPGAVYPVLRLLRLFPDHTCGTGFYYLQVVADGLTVINSAVNFLIYMLCSAEFRTGFYKLGRKLTWSGSSGTQETQAPQPQPL